MSIAVWWSALQSCNCRVLQSPTPAHHWCAGDFTTWEITIASNQVSRRVAKHIAQSFVRQQRAFLILLGDRRLSVSTLSFSEQ